eukprot:1577287-Amphidinium_carterae.1
MVKNSSSSWVVYNLEHFSQTDVVCVGAVYEILHFFGISNAQLQSHHKLLRASTFVQLMRSFCKRACVDGSLSCCCGCCCGGGGVDVDIAGWQWSWSRCINRG